MKQKENKNIHVAMLIDVYGGAFVGGGQIHVANLSSALEKHDCSVDVFSQKNHHMVSRFAESFFVIPRVIFRHFQQRFDCIHSHGYISGLSGKLLSIILRIPVIHTVHGSNLMDLRDNTWKGRLERFLLTEISYDVQISVSQSFLSYTNKAKKVVVIPNGVELQDGVKRDKKKDDKVILLYIGRLEKIKGLDYLFKALDSLKDTIDWELRVIGDGSDAANLKHLAKTLGIEARVHFLGKKTGDALDEEYRNADIFVLPSLTEGQPISLLEAWAHEIPVLVTSVGHNPWTVDNGTDDYIIEPNSIEALKDGILQAFKNRVSWPVMGKRGLEKVKNHYTWPVIAEQVYQVYKDVLSHPKD